MNSRLMKFLEWMLLENIHFAVTSAYRTIEENKACGGSEYSQHLTGDAVDLKPLDMSVDNFISKLKESSIKFDQLIKYRTFVHISFPRFRDPRQMELDFTDRK
nr:MAG TPA: peptidase [Microviridae sp.]